MMGGAASASASKAGAKIFSGLPQIDLTFLTPILLLCAALAAMVLIEPASLTYDGLSLILIGAMPTVLATIAQLFVMASGDLDLGLGQFIGLVNVLVAAMLVSSPGMCVLWLALAVVAYVGVGALITWREIPSIVVTFGMGSIWLGLALIVMPVPSGQAPAWLIGAVNVSPSFVPLPIIVFVVFGACAHFLVFRTRIGVRLRAVGASPNSAARMGIPVMRSKLILYGFAALMALLTGFVVSGISGSGDPYGASSLVLPTVAAVIVGGGEFRGGRVNPIGAICAAVAIGLITSIMAFLNVSAAYTRAFQGLILIFALGIRIVATWTTRRDVAGVK